MAKAVKRRVRGRYHSENPGLVRRDMGETAEHGLGAGGSIGRLSRVRPLERFESSLFSILHGLCIDEKQGGTA